VTDAKNATSRGNFRHVQHVWSNWGPQNAGPTGQIILDGSLTFSGRFATSERYDVAYLLIS